MPRLLALAVVSLILVAAPAAAQDDGCPGKDVIFVPTAQEVVTAMLRLARVTPADVVYDLGSGDGRIPIAAAKNYGARGVGIEVCRSRVQESVANARAQGVADKVRFVQQDLFRADIREATVVTMYLLPRINVELIPKLNRELKPGTRIVSNVWDMSGDGVSRPPRQRVEVNGQRLSLWVTPILPEPAAPPGKKP